MSEISILDLQNLRHLIGGYDNSHCKMTGIRKSVQGSGNQEIIYRRSGFCNEKQTGFDEVLIKHRR